ncbi:hypothetical protein Tco_0439996 [Tanacetum coccineum]
MSALRSVESKCIGGVPDDGASGLVWESMMGGGNGSEWEVDVWWSNIARSLATSASDQTSVGTGAGIEILAVTRYAGCGGGVSQTSSAPKNGFGLTSPDEAYRLLPSDVIPSSPPSADNRHDPLRVYRHPPPWEYLVLRSVRERRERRERTARVAQSLDGGGRDLAPRGQVCSLVMGACKATCTYRSSSIQGSPSCSGPTTPGDPISDNP